MTSRFVITEEVDAKLKILKDKEAALALAQAKITRENKLMHSQAKMMQKGRDKLEGQILEMKREREKMAKERKQFAAEQKRMRRISGDQRGLNTERKQLEKQQKKLKAEREKFNVEKADLESLRLKLDQQKEEIEQSKARALQLMQSGRDRLQQLILQLKRERKRNVKSLEALKEWRRKLEKQRKNADQETRDRLDKKEKELEAQQRELEEKMRHSLEMERDLESEKQKADEALSSGKVTGMAKAYEGDRLNKDTQRFKQSKRLHDQQHHDQQHENFEGRMTEHAEETELIPGRRITKFLEGEPTSEGSSTEYEEEVHRLTVAMKLIVKDKPPLIEQRVRDRLALKGIQAARRLKDKEKGVLPFQIKKADDFERDLTREQHLALKMKEMKRLEDLKEKFKRKQEQITTETDDELKKLLKRQRERVEHDRIALKLQKEDMNKQKTDPMDQIYVMLQERKHRQERAAQRNQRANQSPGSPWNYGCIREKVTFDSMKQELEALDRSSRENRSFEKSDIYGSQDKASHKEYLEYVMNCRT